MQIRTLRLSEFDRDLKKLKKRFKTLEDDLTTFINTQIKLSHELRLETSGIVPIRGLGINSPKIYKAKKFACKSLKGKGVQSGIRISYAYLEDLNKVEFIEIYFKGDKENEDRERIFKYIKNRQSVSFQ
jgi:hypothetical protein